MSGAIPGAVCNEWISKRGMRRGRGREGRRERERGGGGGGVVNEMRDILISIHTVGV